MHDTVLYCNHTAVHLSRSIKALRMIGLFQKVFGSRNQRQLKRYQKTVASINELEPEFQSTCNCLAAWRCTKARSPRCARVNKTLVTARGLFKRALRSRRAHRD